jgi:hypothetical protein
MWEAANAIFTTHIWGWLVYRTHIYGDDDWGLFIIGFTTPRGLYQEPWGLKQQAWGFSMIFHHVTVSSVTPGRMFGVKNGVC